MPSHHSIPPLGAAQLRERLARREALLGCFLSLGSAQIAELMAAAGYDWALIDLEHGPGDERDTLSQMQALATRGCIAIVRVESTARHRVHRVLDFGAHGVMFPRIETAEEARAAVAAMRYPPAGVRGVALANRASSWGSDFHAYLEGSRSLLAIIQIESSLAVENAEGIAAVDGVDVLFIGPSDLSHSMGRFGDFEHPDFLSALRRTAQAALSQRKYCGILLPNPKYLKRYVDLGFQFVAAGSDSGLLNNAARSLIQSLRTELKGSDQQPKEG